MALEAGTPFTVTWVGVVTGSEIVPAELAEADAVDEAPDADRLDALATVDAVALAEVAACAWPPVPPCPCPGAGVVPRAIRPAFASACAAA